MPDTTVRAVFWDFGGVILSSPFEAFNDYERRHGIPLDFIRSVNAVDPDSNAWARLERSDIDLDEFDRQFALESARLGHRIAGADVLGLLSGSVRPEMVLALDRVIAAGYITACLTNNVRARPTDPLRRHGRPDVEVVMARFDHVIESSEVGLRKPDPAFYLLACERAGVAPHECVFLDDLGINLKPAAALGMHTIKVVSAAQAIDELELRLGIPLRDR